MTKEEIRADKAKEVAESLSRAGITPEVAQEILKELDEAEREGKDNVHIRVINIKTSKKRVDDSQEVAEEELRKAQNEAKPEPAPEKKPEAGECTLDTLVAANIRFAKAVENLSNEYFRLSQLAAGFLKENQELRTKLGEK